MDKLELKHLAPYLPYELKAVLTQDHRENFSSEDYYDENIFIAGAIWEVSGYANGKLHIPCGEGDLNGFIYNSGYTYACFDNGIKPILRPMSDLTKEIEHNGERFIPYYSSVFVRHRMNNGYPININTKWMPYWCVQKLCEWHFDIFGLIDADLAIDINTLNKYNHEI